MTGCVLGVYLGVSRACIGDVCTWVCTGDVPGCVLGVYLVCT